MKRGGGEGQRGGKGDRGTEGGRKEIKGHAHTQGFSSLTCCAIAGPDAHCHPPYSPSCPHDGEGFGGALQSGGESGAELEASSTSLVIDDRHQGGEISGGETGGGGCERGRVNVGMREGVGCVCVEG